jgi:hypothetical protein
MIAQADPELLTWLLGIYNGIPSKSGSFLESLALMALRADESNYEILRPALLLIRDKYPKYGTVTG